MTAVLAVAGGSWIVVGVCVVFVLAVAYGYYTRRGSGINQRPTDGRGGSPGAKGHSVMSTTEDETERTVGTRGTK